MGGEGADRVRCRALEVVFDLKPVEDRMSGQKEDWARSCPNSSNWTETCVVADVYSESLDVAWSVFADEVRTRLKREGMVGDQSLDCRSSHRSVVKICSRCSSSEEMRGWSE